MDNETYITALRECSEFDSLESDELRVLLEAGEPRTLITGEALWSKGDVGEAAHILVEGRVELTRHLQPEGQQTEQWSRTGTILGLPMLIHDWEHESSAYPVERTETLRLERRAFEQLFEDRHAVAFRLIDMLTDELVDEMRDANRRLQEVFGQPGETLHILRRRAQNRERR